MFLLAFRAALGHVGDLAILIHFCRSSASLAHVEIHICIPAHSVMSAIYVLAGFPRRIAPSAKPCAQALFNDGNNR